MEEFCGHRKENREEEESKEESRRESALCGVLQEDVVRVIRGGEDALLDARLDEAETVGPPSEERTLPRESPRLFPKLLALRDGRCSLCGGKRELFRYGLHRRELRPQGIEAKNSARGDAEKGKNVPDRPCVP